MQFSLARRWSAWLPVAMSLAALATVLSHVAVYGIAREADEGAAAHIFQLLMAAQIPVILVFLARSIPRAPAQAATICGLQILAALAALAPVWFLRL